MIQVTGTFEIEGREVIRTEQQEQAENNDNAELPDVLALINETQHDPDHLNDVSVIPLQCGMGKSTAISKKIREVIENLDEDGNGDGLLVVTDNVARMKAYLQCDDPGYEPELFAFLEKNMTKITVMTHDNVIEAAIRMRETPVLLITTQRYFNMLTINEIDRDYLYWKGGRRTLILIDEQPYLKPCTALKRTDINDINSAIRDGIVDIEDQEKKKRILAMLERQREILFKDFDRYEHQYTDKKQHYLFYLIEKFDAAEGNEWKKYIEKYRGQINRYRGKDKFTDMYTKCRAYYYMLRNGGIYEFRSKSTGAYVSQMVVTLDNVPHVWKVAAKVIILDATASNDMPEYNCDDEETWHYHFVDCSAYNRRFDNLTIKLVDCGGSGKSAQEFIRGKRAELFTKVENVFHQDGVNPVVFTYDIVESDYATVHGEERVAHFGDIRGKNDFVHENVIAQVGMFRYTASYYLGLEIEDNILLRSKLMYEQLKDPAQTAEIFAKKLGDPESRTNQYMNKLLLADIEQNMMRGSIRHAANAEPYTFYLFTSFSEYANLLKMLDDRFTSMGAVVHYQGKDICEKTQKAISRNMSGGRKSKAQLFFEWYTALDTGAEYKGADIRKAMLLDDKANIGSFATEKNGIAQILTKDRIPNGRGVYKKGGYGEHSTSL